MPPLALAVWRPFMIVTKLSKWNGAGEEARKADCSRLRSEWVVRTQRQDVNCSFKDLEMLGYKEK